MEVKTLFNAVVKFTGFIVSHVCFSDGDRTSLDIHIVPRKGSKPICSCCGKPGTTYDKLPQRRVEHVPVWGIRTFIVYCARRVRCRTCDVYVEVIPWVTGKSQQTVYRQSFLAYWARKMAWETVAKEFNTTWNRVRDAVFAAVEYGLATRDLSTITAIGIDEIAAWARHKYLTLVYQIDGAHKRLLWAAKGRRADQFKQFFTDMGEQNCSSIKFVCSDMWQAYLKVVHEKLPNAIHILDRFHIVANLNKAIDEIRRQEVNQANKDNRTVLTKTKFLFLKRPENLTAKQQVRLDELLQLNLKVVKAYLLKLDFENFWLYKQPAAASRFLSLWCSTVMRTRLEPLKAFARSMRSHENLILNWFRAKKAFNSGVVEALNSSAKLTLKKARGFRSEKTLITALYHQLGDLPVNGMHHKFW
jgi:transposase